MRRQVWVDQARWAAVALVLIGHLVGPLRGRSTLAHAISDYVYIFHIPALVLLAGWGARRTTADGRTLTRIFWALLVPYVLFQLIAFGVNWELNGQHPSWTFVDQTFGLWFLVSLASWRLLAPWFRGLRAPVLVALLVALLAGASPRIGTTLSLQRTAFFLPMFIAGPWIVDQVSVWRQRTAVRLGALAVLAVAGLAVLIRQPHFDRTIFFGRDSYHSLGQGLAHGVLARLGALGLATGLAVALFLAVPGGRFETSTLGRLAAQAGQHTMYPYLLHLPVLLIAGWSGWYAHGSPTAAAVVAALVGLGLAMLFVTPPVRLVAGIVVEPRAWWDRVRPGGRIRKRAVSPSGR
jgi:fucose 4-O-acetylase-like acetyltransferase